MTVQSMLDDFKLENRRQSEDGSSPPSKSSTAGWGIWANPIRSPPGTEPAPRLDESPFDTVQDGWQANGLRRNSILTDPPPASNPVGQPYAGGHEFRSSSFSGQKPRLDFYGSSPTYQSFRQNQAPMGATSPRFMNQQPSSNILDRFQQVAESTREVEMLNNGMNKLQLDQNVPMQGFNPPRSDLNSPSSLRSDKSPYISPTPVYGSIDHQAFQQQPPQPQPQPQPHLQQPAIAQPRSNSMSSVWRPTAEEINTRLYNDMASYPMNAVVDSEADPMPQEFAQRSAFMQNGTSPPIQGGMTPPVRSNSGGAPPPMFHPQAINFQPPPPQQQQTQRYQPRNSNGFRYDQSLDARVTSPHESSAPQSQPPPLRRDKDFNIRSPLLEEFRSNKNKKYELTDLYGHIVEFSGDQHGSRFIQQRLESASSEEKEIIFNEIRPNSLQLMTDVFGNYVIQKFFELGNQVQKTVLAKQMTGNILSLSLQMYGCRVVQKAIEHVLADQQAMLVQELDGNVLKCVKDQNGNHVIQKAIERIPGEYIGFILDSFHNQVYQLATHPYGCRVIQRMLEHSDEASQQLLLTELHKFTQYLVEDQYGNYVIQHVIQKGNVQDREKSIAVVTSNLLTFSRHKYASNVVEKCIIYGTAKQRSDVIDMIITPRASDNQLPIVMMMRDQFANYVIQKLLSTTRGHDHDRLIAAIKPELQNIKKYSYGKHLASIEKWINQSQNEQ